MIEVRSTPDIEYDDVVEFLKQGKPENFVLDYKLQISDKKSRLAKTIASMANTYGGTILIGVNEDQEVPIAPFEGYPCNANYNIRQTIDNLIVEHIKTPVFVELKECIDPTGTYAFCVVRVPLSPLAPHSVGENNAYYIRTGQRTRQEDLATPDKIIWLRDHRLKSVEMRDRLVGEAFERFDELHYLSYDASGIARENLPSRTLCFVPLYPSGEIFRYDMARLKLQEASFPADGLSYPRIDSSVESRSITHGMFFSSSPNDSIPKRTIELNNYGMYMHRQELTEFHLSHLFKDICRLVVFAVRFYSLNHYWGSIRLLYRLDEIRDKEFDPHGEDMQTTDRRRKENGPRLNKMVTNSIVIERDIPFGELRENACWIAKSMARQLAWDAGDEPVQNALIDRFVDSTISTYTKANRV